MEIIDLPHDIFLLIVAHLSARSALLCRRVSRRWHAAFTNDALSLWLLKRHFPRSREARHEHQLASSSSSSTFAAVASRYHHLRTATPRSVEKLDNVTKDDDDDFSFFSPAAGWDRVLLELDGRTAPLHHPDPSWCYGRDEGVLVYYHHHHHHHHHDAAANNNNEWRLLDLATHTHSRIAFPRTGRTVRRVRLAAGVLVFEWTSQQQQQQQQQKHYATAFDVVGGDSSSSSSSKWTAIPRAEWELPDGQFLSAHTGAHYAVYAWRNDDDDDDDDDGERLVVWDISSSSSPSPLRVLRGSAFYGVRRAALRGLELDARNVYLVEEEHRWARARGLHDDRSPPRMHVVRCTGIPIIGDGPAWRDECGGGGGGGGGGADHDSMVAFWCRRTPRGTGAARLPCWRHDGFPYLTVAETWDAAAGVRVAARRCFMLETMSVHARPFLEVSAGESGGGGARFGDGMWDELLGAGALCGDERWLVGEDAQGVITVVRF